MEFFCWFFCSSHCCPKKKGEYAQLRAKKKKPGSCASRKERACWVVGLLAGLAGFAGCGPAGFAGWGLLALLAAGLLALLAGLCWLVFPATSLLLLLYLSFSSSIPREASRSSLSTLFKIGMWAFLEPQSGGMCWKDNLGLVGFSGMWAFNFIIVHFIFTLKHNIKFRLYKINIIQIK